MWKDMLIIIHLPPSYTPGQAGISHMFLFLLQQLASLQEQLDSLIEKWPPGGSVTSASAAHPHPEEKEEEEEAFIQTGGSLH